jgi:hypothetical protein
METGNILKPTATTGQTIAGKIGRFISSWLLAEVILIGAVFNFLDRLNQKGILGMGDEFATSQLYWGDEIGMNIFRLGIIIVFAGFFGFLYGYFSKRIISISEKIIINIINAFFSVFGTLFIVLIIVSIFLKGATGEINSGISVILHTFIVSPFYLTFLILNLIGSFVAGFYFIDIGTKTISNPNLTIDKQRSGTFLGIKWYHYLWLWLPIGFYAQVALNLIYATGHALITLVKNVRWFDFLGGVVVSDNGITSQNSLNIAWGKLITIYFAGIIIYYLFEYLREVLAGEKQINTILKILVSLGIGIVIPFLLLWFTALGG